MPWERTDNPWIRKMRRHCIVGTVAMACVGVFMLVMFGFMWSLMDRISSGSSAVRLDGLQWLMLVPVAINLIPMFIGVYSLRRSWRILRRVPDHDAMVCPKCLGVMEDEDESRVRCPKGHSIWPRVELLHYWEQFGLARMASWRTLRAQRRRYENKRRDFWGRYHEWAQEHWVPAIVGIPPIVAAIAAAVDYFVLGQTVLETVRFVPYIYLLMTGCICIGFGMKQRRGEEEFCASCDYQRVGVGEPQPERCPECGAAWNEPGAVVRGRLVSRPWLGGLGFAITLAAMFSGPALSSGGMMSGLFARAVPTSVLIQSVGSSPDAGADDWTALNNRTLTADERNHLAELLLDQRESVSYFEVTDGAGWLESNFTALRPGLANRYLSGLMRLRLHGPTSIQLGEKARLTVGGSPRVRSKPAWVVAGAIAGFDADNTYHAGAGAEWIDELSFHSTFDAETFSWDEPGRHVIHYTIWIVVRPGRAGKNAGVPLAWNDDGSPVTPSDALYVMPIRLEHTIDVVR